MTKEQLTKNKFHFSIYIYKKNNPQEHSCAVCKNRPIDFCNVPNTHRINHEEAWHYKDGITDEEIFEAIRKDAVYEHMLNENMLKDFRKCPISRWSKAAPFYSNDKKCFREE